MSYLPSGIWCNWVDGSCYQGPTEVKVLGSNSPASFTFLKGGTAVMTQNSANTTEASREQKVCLGQGNDLKTCYVIKFVSTKFIEAKLLRKNE